MKAEYYQLLDTIRIDPINISVRSCLVDWLIENGHNKAAEKHKEFIKIINSAVVIMRLGPKVYGRRFGRWFEIKKDTGRIVWLIIGLTPVEYYRRKIHYLKWN